MKSFEIQVTTEIVKTKPSWTVNLKSFEIGSHDVMDSNRRKWTVNLKSFEMFEDEKIAARRADEL